MARTFRAWLRDFTARHDAPAWSDLWADIREDPDWPRVSKRDVLRGHLLECGAVEGCLDAFDAAYDRYEQEQRPVRIVRRSRTLEGARWVDVMVNRRLVFVCTRGPRWGANDWGDGHPVEETRVPAILARAVAKLAEMEGANGDQS